MISKVLDPVIVSRYEETHLRHRERIQDLWQKAQQRLPLQDTEQLVELCQKVGGRTAMPSPVWFERAGRFLGGCHANDVRMALQYHMCQKRIKLGQDLNAGRSRVFVGKGWDDVLVIPFYTAPGRINAFMFVGRDATDPEDFVFKRVTPIISQFECKDQAPMWDSGLTMYETLMRDHQKFGTTAFILNDPILALKLQLRHLRDSNTPLPICGSIIDGKVSNRWVWRSMFPRDYIIWAPEMCPELIQQAVRANGRIAIGDSLTAMVDDPAKRRPVEWLERMERMAKPWATVLEEEFQKKDVAECENLLLSLQLTDAELDRFISGCCEPVRVKLDQIYAANKRQYRSVSISGKTVIEEDGYWKLESGEIISDTVIRIENVVYFPDENKTDYRGYVTRNDQVIEFADNATIIEKNTGAWVRNLLARNGAGRANIQRNWTQHLLGLAQGFHEPESYKGIESFGWNDDRLIFPNFEIYSGGRVLNKEAWYTPNELVPAQDLYAPEHPSREVVELLGTSGLTASIFWAAAAHVTSNLLAELLHQERRGLVLLGAAATSIGNAAVTSLGCITTELVNCNQYAKRTVDTHINKVTRHPWPVYLEREGKKDAALTAWLAHPEACNSVVSLPACHAYAMMVNGNWNLLCAEGTPSAGGTIERIGRVILPAYLHNLATRNFRLTYTDTYTNSVLTDMAAWFGDITHDDTVFKQAATILDTESDPIDYFVRLTYLGMTTGLLTTINEEFEEGHQPAITVAENHVRIHKDQVSKLVTTHDTQLLDLVRLSRELRSAGVLLQEDDTHWQLDKTWWTENIGACDLRARTTAQGGTTDAGRRSVR